MISSLESLFLQWIRDRERRALDLRGRTEKKNCQHNLLEDPALLLTCVKYLLLKTTAVEEGAHSHAVFGFPYLGSV